MSSRLRLIVASWAVACAPEPGASAPTADAADDVRDGWPACEQASEADALRLNHLQLLGTHNSYHVEPENPVHPSHRYTHPPLDAQLDLGVRQFELDVHLRVDEGFEIFHLPVIDEETTCLALSTCLEVIRDWSKAHPCHVPIVVWIEPKDEDMDALDPTLAPLIDEHHALEDAILEVWPRERILTPDDLRGAHADLPSAIRADGWPRLDALRGKLVLSMLDRSNHRARYLEDSDILRDRLMFVAADGPDDPFAAMFKINNAASEGERIQALAAEGFHITSNVDGAARSPEEREAHLEASLAGAPHALSSDFVVPDPDSGYVARLPDGSPGCHPTAPADCDASLLEP